MLIDFRANIIEYISISINNFGKSPCLPVFRRKALKVRNVEFPSIKNVRFPKK